MMLVHTDAIEPGGGRMFELIEIGVVRAMHHFGIEEAGVEVDPRAVRFIVETLIERGTRHQMEQECLHLVAWHFPVRCSTGLISSASLTTISFPLPPKQSYLVSPGSP